jgi:hypothetical protein
MSRWDETDDDGFLDITTDQPAIAVTEFTQDYRTLDWKPVSAPK